jgi:hypothetical protein
MMINHKSDHCGITKGRMAISIEHSTSTQRWLRKDRSYSSKTAKPALKVVAEMVLSLTAHRNQLKGIPVRRNEQTLA